MSCYGDDICQVPYTMSSSSTIGIHEMLDFSWKTRDHAEKNAEYFRVKSPVMLTYGGGGVGWVWGTFICGSNKTIKLWKVLVRHSAVEDFGLTICQGRKE